VRVAGENIRSYASGVMEAVIQKLRDALAARGDVAFAVLFGSAARGQLRPTSDLDVAVRLTRSLEGWALGGLVMDLSEATRRRIDVVLLPEVRSALLLHEIGKGSLLLGDREEWIELRRRAMREWREVRPRFLRCSEASLRKFLAESPTPPRGST
jgi:predicted nucleotidyltransferase